MNRRLRRRIRVAGYLATGALLLQFGQACTIVNSVATAGIGSSGILIDDNGFFLGLFNVCGRENILPVNANDFPVGDVMFTEDDLMFGCPATRILVEDDGGG